MAPGHHGRRRDALTARSTLAFVGIARTRHVFVAACFTSLSAGCQPSEPSAADPAERLGTAASAIIGGAPSTSADDFVVFLVSAAKASVATNDFCGATLVAPNLVLTAKHCVYHYLSDSKSICDASGEPQLGAPGGYVTGPLPDRDVRIFTGPNGRKRFIDKAEPDAIGIQVIDDESPALCSHDLAYVVLDRPIVGAPTATLRLGRRPEAGPAVTIALAGWGTMENRQGTAFRTRRSGIQIQRVGPAAPMLDSDVSLAPRSFETGPAACSGDSGSPGFVEGTGAVLGVVARALNTDPSDPVSPCAPSNVINVYMAVTDFAKPLRRAFAAANAQPWLEGRSAPGYVAFGEACQSSLECAGNLCVGATTTQTGTCNVACAEAGQACPSGFACAGNECVVSAEAPPPLPTTLPTATAPAVSPTGSTFAVGGGGCQAGASGAGPVTPSGAVAAAVTACAFMVGRIRMSRRRRDASIEE